MESSRVSKTPKKPAVIALTPSVELVFNVPEGLDEDKQQPISATLTITNPTLDALCFKVKTTAPKDYCVRPNSGTLQSRDKVDINVMLQPPLPLGGLSKDKFLVQTIYVGDVEDPTSPDMWKFANKSLIMENRLKCRWNMVEPGGVGGPSTPQANVVKPVSKPGGSPSFTKTTTTTTSSSTVSPNEYVNPTETKPTKVEEKSKQVEDNNNNNNNNTKSAAKAVRTTSTTTPTTTTSSSSRKSSVTAVATTQSATNPEQVPSILLLLAVFLLGYIFGKFVL